MARSPPVSTSRSGRLNRQSGILDFCYLIGQEWSRPRSPPVCDPGPARVTLGMTKMTKSDKMSKSDDSGLSRLEDFLVPEVSFMTPSSHSGFPALRNGSSAENDPRR